jgi:hypothetical protein
MVEPARVEKLFAGMIAAGLMTASEGEQFSRNF